jgi:polar amino acid transport system substrate-binding protein
MKKKLLLTIILVTALALTLTACGGEKKAAEQTTWERVQAEGKLVAGLDDNYPPMGYRNENNELVGFDIEMGAELGKRLGIEIEWQPTAWDGVVASLKAKKFDVIISGMTITEERLQEVDFAGPYIYAAQALAVKADNEDVKAAADLAGKVVGTQNGSTGLKVAEELNTEIGFSEIKGYSDYALAFQDLKIGRLDAIISDNYVIAGYIENMPGEFKFTGELFSEETNGIAVRKEDKDLYEAINGALEEMIVDGTMGQLAEKWLGGDVTLQLKEQILAERNK